MSPATWLDIISGKRLGLVRLLVRVASYPYAAWMRLRNFAYDRGWKAQHAASVPVIVVGNLTVGGTGKTPAVELIARWFRQHDVQVAILSRGYGSDSGHNDEAKVLEENLPDVPHLQGIDRVALAHTAVEELESELLVLDDGFQHRRLKRDLDIVLVDATNPWGFGYCLPGGLLREPLSGICRAGLLVITRADQVTGDTVTAVRQRLAKLHPQCPIVISQHAPRCLQNASEEKTLTELQNRPVAAFCGIGNPEAFWHTLRTLGCNLSAQRTFPDHHNYQRSDVDDLVRWAETLPPDTWLITTQKDFVKLHIDALGTHPLWSLPIALHVTDGQEQLDAALSLFLPKDEVG